MELIIDKLISPNSKGPPPHRQFGVLILTISWFLILCGDAVLVAASEMLSGSRENDHNNKTLEERALDILKETPLIGIYKNFLA